MKKGDFILIGVIILVGVLIWIPFKLGQKQNGEMGKAVVTIDGIIYGAYNLDEEVEEKIVLKDKSYNVLKIVDGEADIISASCPDQYCVEHRKVSKNNETIVCLPNKLIVTIKSNEEAEVDMSTN